MKKIITVLSIISLLLLFGGIYLIGAIDSNTSRFDEILMFHRVEILREHLLLNIRSVEADLYSQNTSHVENVDVVVQHVRETSQAINTCFTCHHSEKVTERLLDVKNKFARYGHALSRALTMRATAGRIQAEREQAHLIGNSLIHELSTMIVMTSKMLAARTEETQRKVHRTRIFLIMLVAAGPLLIMGLAFIVIKGVKRPVEVLLEATRKLKAGDLEHRIGGLRDEFAELAVGLNTMAGSLRERMRETEDSEKRYRLLFESAGDSIFIVDAEGNQACRIVESNAAAAKMHGYTGEELKTMNIADLDSPADAMCTPSWVDRMRHGEWINVEADHKTKAGTLFPVEISAGAFEFSGHRYFLMMARDITERKQAEKTLQRTEQLRMAGELATGLAHEIKNPLAGIKVSIEVLAREAYLSEEDRGILVQVIDEIRRIEVLMKELLNFARPPRPQFVSTDVNGVLDAVSSLVRQNSVHAPDALQTIAIVKDFDSHLPAITADPMQLKQVFMNLLLNAVDAMPDGGTLRIKTWLDATAHAVRIEISDTGRGIDSAVMDKIFQPFFTTKQKGTGLGLAISKRLIEDHGGKIGIEQNPGGGAAFKIGLPVIQSERVHTI